MCDNVEENNSIDQECTWEFWAPILQDLIIPKTLIPKTLIPKTFIPQFFKPQEVIAQDFET
ncbi:CIC11C00000003431 [Sungouiella intermedia]|uniref:CIC11C00000003431 n=1 Tax=Sungouiella intermedia TaxID=45354 RepID=A0A1L0D6F1_9ASCO|nr:CIC11C00000003431 [[Candida] intermedia]